MRKKAWAIELFHLAFMQVAAATIPPGEHALKGGGNLRFFLRSGRRSGDLELDFLGHGFAGSAKRMGRLLKGPALKKLLALHDIQLLDIHLRKDTATVKRWMFRLVRPGMEDATSKIEFSNRGSSGEALVEQADTDLARKPGGIAVRFNHYPPATAIEQKVLALVGRTETEPRDVFDLDHLLRQFPDALARADLERNRTGRAADIAEHISYESYRDLVVPYLEEDIVDLYRSAKAWQSMQLHVSTQLRARVAV